MKRLAIAFALSILGTAATAQDFTVDFSWEGLALCTSGRPNTVGNPAFTLENVPDGTQWLYFQLTDVDAPNYPHGGGWIAYEGETTAKDVFTYKSPCPPNGVHNYTWEVSATVSQDRINTLGAASLTRKYPE